LAIDNGSHHDFATGGGEPLKTFQSAPLDQGEPKAYGNATYSEGSFNGDNQFGTMEVTDNGGSTIDVTWKGFDNNDNQLVSYSFSINV